MSTRPKKFTAERRDCEALVLKNKHPKGARSLTLTSVAIARDESRRLDTRREQRKALREPAQVRFRGVCREVQLINLSSRGAMIEGSLGPNISETVVLNLNGDMPECVVRWVKGKRTGVEYSNCPQPRSTGRDREPRREIAAGFVDSSGAENSVSKSGGEGDVATLPFLNRSGDPIDGSHRWTARLRNIAASDLPVRSPGRFRLASDTLLDLSNSGLIRARISWSRGDRSRRTH